MEVVLLAAGKREQRSKKNTDRLDIKRKRLTYALICNLGLLPNSFFLLCFCRHWFRRSILSWVWEKECLFEVACLTLDSTLLPSLPLLVPFNELGDCKRLGIGTFLKLRSHPAQKRYPDFGSSLLAMRSHYCAFSCLHIISR